MKVNWHPITTAPKDVFVLVVRDSGYVTTSFEYLTAKYCSQGNRWEDVANDNVRNSGSAPLYWTKLPDAPTNNNILKPE